MAATSPLAESWLVSNRITLYTLDHIPDKDLSVAHSSRSRTVADQFAHLHNVRILWLSVSHPTLAKTLTKIDKGTATKKQLREALEASGEAMAQLLTEVEKTGKVKSYKKSPQVFFAYIIAHEAHHRGQILLHLKYAGVPFDKEESYKIWEWDRI